MMDWKPIKMIVNKTLLDEANNLYKLSTDIWKQPELNYHEHNAHKVLTEFLELHGFVVHRKYFMSTAFRAEYSNATEDAEEVTTVCIMCEYDALPGIGHGCGHNLIAEAGVAAGLAIKAVMNRIPEIVGRLIVMGTPAEEGGGGKIRLINADALKDIHFAMMVHPSTANVIYCSSMATAGVSVNYFGEDCSDDAKINFVENCSSAMDAAVVCYNNIASFRQQMKPSWRLQCIITKGGQDMNVLPSHTSMLVNYRAATKSEVLQMQEPLAQCFDGAATSTACQVQYKFRPETGYRNLLLNEPLLRTYEEFALETGAIARKQSFRKPTGGSTDMGNVSWVVPSIHPRYAIPASSTNHTKGFTLAAGAKSAQIPTLKAARCMALTTLKLFTDSDLRDSARKAFKDASVSD